MIITKKMIDAARAAGRELAGDQPGALVEAFGEVAVAGLSAALASRDVTEEPVAWMVTGSRTFKDNVWATKIGAQGMADQRKDGSVLVPLYTRPLPLPSEEKMREALEKAYIRGATWYQQNDDGLAVNAESFLRKAARDYADYETAPLKAEGESL